MHGSVPLSMVNSHYSSGIPHNYVISLVVSCAPQSALRLALECPPADRHLFSRAVVRTEHPLTQPACAARRARRRGAATRRRTRRRRAEEGPPAGGPAGAADPRRPRYCATATGCALAAATPTLPSGADLRVLLTSDLLVIILTEHAMEHR